MKFLLLILLVGCTTDANNVTLLNPEPVKTGSILFTTGPGAPPSLEIKPNGDFLVKGKKITNDMEVYEAFKEWLRVSGQLESRK